MAREDYGVWWGPPVEWGIRALWCLLWAWRPFFDNCRIGRLLKW